MSLVKNGSICVRLNDRNEPFFKPGKGLRQGDPISPSCSTWWWMSLQGC
jgi:hypothetical protein